MSPENRNIKKYPQFLRAAFGALFVVCLFGFSEIDAKSLAKYKEDINHIKSDFASLVSQDENSREENRSTEEAIYGELPNMLPSKDTWEIEGHTVEVNNEWLTNKVSEYRSNTSNAANRRLIASEIYERLGAIEIKITELEESIAASLTKDENKQKLAEILKREEYAKSVEEEGFLSRLWRRFVEWLKSLFPKAETKKSTPNQGLGSVFYFLQILIYVLVFAVIAFVVYKFAPFFIKKLRAAKRNKKTERIILGEKISADETSDNLFSEAEKLARDGNLRGAIRKGYIALLFELSERNVIGLAKHKTNRDYLRDVRKRNELHKNMDGLTLNYERHWYGFEAAEARDWEEFRDGYKAAIDAKS